MLEPPWQSLRHSALCCSLTERCRQGAPCPGSSPMLWISPGCPWGLHGLNPVACLSAGKAAGNICDWDKEIFGPQGLSGQIPSMVVSVTVSDQQQGRLVQDKVLQGKHWGLFEAKAEPSLRGHRLALGFKKELLNNPQSRRPGRRETLSPCLRTGGTELVPWPWRDQGESHCCGSAQGHGGLAAEHVCSCFAKSGVFLQKHCPEIQSFLILPLSCACSTTPLPWRWLFITCLSPAPASGWISHP